MNKEYDYVIIGAGIAGCSLAYFLKKYSKSILLIDRNSNVAFGASGAAGAFLSPLLGKPNDFKDLIAKSLIFSTNFYKNLSEDLISNCGVCRIPKNGEDRDKFESYKPYMDFKYTQMDDGYFFEIGSQVTPSLICEKLTKDIEKKLSYNVEKLEQNQDSTWIINDELCAKNIILTTGADIKHIKEEYFDIRGVWGQKIDVSTTTQTHINYHKECSVSKASKIEGSDLYKVSIGATHHKFNCDKNICNYCIETANINDCSKCYNNSIVNSDSVKLIALANDIIKLENVEVIDVKIGARASSNDYFPMIGKLVDSKKSIEKFPHLLNGTHIKNSMLETVNNLYVINGVGGRGFVLSPYLANELVEHIINDKQIEDNLSNHRLFKRWAKKQKNKDIGKK
ncbi:FAD-dependent oxidoreductase, possible FAD-dependent cmnm(5)s(2)U34 oxidoreductase [Arcobacter acticola]|uniref:FAD-dependent oxidoreductase, possible FAD-dependent cmnm(5)s(2)U34 oxidoreductase n=1 Tax=Arcobacter acticola TaxID=1849015 RepID=A0A6M8EEY7_9BACT|nr:FAD-dependent oxidoreductase [Arcobacter acticola]QKE28562.1 FAD-dependent oxidoreductase, possible FAD-dependent cmnm(5)s(2)U34 oxidoreductase [Arcobacter acticola]